MYIDPFWCGVLVTIIVEAVGLLIVAAVAAAKDAKKK